METEDKKNDEFVETETTIVEISDESGEKKNEDSTKESGKKKGKFKEKLKKLWNTPDTTEEFEQTDIDQNKLMSVFAYLGPLVLIPIFAAPKSKYARFHASEGLTLFLAEVLFAVLYGIFRSIIIAISWRIYFLVRIVGFLGVILGFLALVGLINVAQGRAKEIPVFGKLRLFH